MFDECARVLAASVPNLFRDLRLLPLGAIVEFGCADCRIVDSVRQLQVRKNTDVRDIHDMEREGEFVGSDELKERFFDSVGLRCRRIEEARVDYFVIDATLRPDVSGALFFTFWLCEGRWRDGSPLPPSGWSSRVIERPRTAGSATSSESASSA